MSYPEKLLDLEIINERKSFADETDDQSFWQLLLNQFKEIAPGILVDIQNAFVANDISLMARKLHELLGMSRNIGAKALAQQLTSMLQHVRYSGQMPVESDVKSITGLYHQTISLLEND